MSTFAMFLALGGGSLAAAASDKDSSSQSAHEQGDGSGETGNDDAGKGANGSKADHDRDGGGSNNGDESGSGGNGSAAENTDGGGPLNVTTRDGNAVSTDSKTGLAMASASCENGEKLVGGGVRTEPSGEAQSVVRSSAPDGNGWTAEIYNSAGLGQAKATAYVLCVSQ